MLSSIIKRTQESLATRKFKDALEITGEASKLYVQLAELYKLRGDAYAGLKQLDNAVSLYKRSLKLVSTDARLNSKLAYTLARLGRDDEAKVFYERALKLDPKLLSAIRGFTDHTQIPCNHPYALYAKEIADNDQSPLGRRADACMIYGRILITEGQDQEGFNYIYLGNNLLLEFYKTEKSDADDCKSAFGMDKDFYDAYRRDVANETVCPAILVTGLSRSGKSLVEYLLSKHPMLLASGERAGLRKVVDYYKGQPAEQIEKIRSESKDPLVRFYNKLLKDLGGSAPQRLIDTSPSNLYVLGFLGLLHPEVPVVVCQRSPLDLGASIYFKQFSAGHMYSCNLDWLGEMMANADLLIEHWLKVLPNPVMVIQYEDLVSDPVETMRKLFDFLGLGYADVEMESKVQLSTNVPVFSAHSFATYPSISQDLVGFGRRFESQLRPMIDSYTNTLNKFVLANA